MNLVSLHCIWLVSLVCFTFFARCFHKSRLQPGSKWPTVFIDCNGGNDKPNCGTSRNTSCKTLQYVTQKIAQNINSSHIAISVAPGLCSEQGTIKLDCDKTIVKSWSFVGSKLKSRPYTVIQVSIKTINCLVHFSDIYWSNSPEIVAFDIHISDVIIEQSLMDSSSIQFMGINTNLVLRNTLVRNCSSGNHELPLFLLQSVYSHQSGLLIENSTFYNNPSPIVYGIQLDEMSVNNTLFSNNGISASSNQSLITISALLLTFEDSRLDQTLGTAIEVKSAKVFTAKHLVFSSNNGSNGSCLLVHSQSNISLADLSFKNNANPVIYVEEEDNVNIDVKDSHFLCNPSQERKATPFVEVPDGLKITFTNCTRKESCAVHCKSGELLKSRLFCQKCQAGSFSHSDDDSITSESCQSCPTGTYSTSSGSTNCTKCSEGTYAEKKGSVKCKKCRNEFFTSYAGADSCTKATLEFILVMAISVPLICIPLVVLIGRHIKEQRKDRSSNNYVKKLRDCNASVQADSSFFNNGLQ